MVDQAGDLAPTTGLIDYLRQLLLTAEKSSHMMASWQVRPVEVPVTLLRASNDTDGAPDLGWSEVLGRPIELAMVPGDHLSMVRAPLVLTSALCIEARLDPPERRPGGGR
ncbi:hypothetical protein [Chondromyces apiculatus]|uniref:Long-chain-fatty-acid--CoA ligase n=1 Tax=Chondromyces apiculatus DSM 436 TaxID=1192034 RepID=A0A017T757_9BACT|nr:hypothetical protein [Chondromyces apiculatus]EYF05073.1 Long-chain-fatty-acid--CoA ligase [Chondromyces apiculatus DSM 436]